MRAPNRSQAASRQLNKGRDEIRSLSSAALSAESCGFPLAAQGARLCRQTDGKEGETVGLITSLPPQELCARQWLKLNRGAWSIESGLHQRLDISHLDDLSRVRTPRSMLVMGMFRRLSNSLCMHWISRHRRPEHQTTTDFFTAMNANHHSYALKALFSARPAFKSAS